jgi:hypothetical protein
VTVPAESLSAVVESVEETERWLEIRVQLRNSADRALHYISDVRRILYDPDTRALSVHLSDEGREVILHPAVRPPTFRYIDPGAQAEITLRLPQSISKLGTPPDPERRQVNFVRQRIADAEEVTVEIAWADVPFYEDPRAGDAKELPTVRWQQHRLQTTYRRPRG